MVAVGPRECKCEKMQKKHRRYTKVHLQSSSGSSCIDLLRSVSVTVVEERKWAGWCVKGMMMTTTMIVFLPWKYVNTSEPLLTAGGLLHTAQRHEKWD